MGVVQEQHPDRAKLYRQWRKLGWPIYVDSLNLLGLSAVPVPVALDESGIVRVSRPNPRTFVRDFIDADFQRYNQKLIAGFFSAPGCFHIMLKNPLADGPLPLEGQKIRANRTYTPVIEPLGGSIVTLAAGEIYSAMEKGVVDGAFPSIATFLPSLT